MDNRRSVDTLQKEPSGNKYQSQVRGETGAPKISLRQRTHKRRRI